MLGARKGSGQGYRLTRKGLLYVQVRLELGLLGAQKHKIKNKRANWKPLLKNSLTNPFLKTKLF